MSRRGNCWDDAVAESFFSTRKTERVPAQGFATRAAARAANRERIDDFYNLRRRRSRNGCVSPIEDELARQAARCAA
jgi:transposase InsO family protein